MFSTWWFLPEYPLDSWPTPVRPSSVWNPHSWVVGGVEKHHFPPKFAETITAIPTQSQILNQIVFFLVSFHRYAGGVNPEFLNFLGFYQDGDGHVIPSIFCPVQLPGLGEKLTQLLQVGLLPCAGTAGLKESAVGLVGCGWMGLRILQI